MTNDPCRQQEACTTFEQMSKTAKTELRDMFLAQRCAKVVTVPWYAFDFNKENAGSPVKILETRKKYVKDLLATELGVAL